MEEIKNTIDVFERLRKYQYKITVENGMVIQLRFERERYHHLAGFQHLTDLPRSRVQSLPRLLLHLHLLCRK